MSPMTDISIINVSKCNFLFVYLIIIYFDLNPSNLHILCNSHKQFSVFVSPIHFIVVLLNALVQNPWLERASNYSQQKKKCNSSQASQPL